mgnify:CR=1 FL=1
MAKKSMIAREVKREKLVKQYATKRAALKAIINDKEKPVEERFKATLELAKLPRNSSAVRLHNRCQLTGRPHAFYRKLKLSTQLCNRFSMETDDVANAENPADEEIVTLVVLDASGIAFVGHGVHVCTPARSNSSCASSTW